MGHVVTAGTISATVIIPDFENGGGLLANSTPKHDAADRRRLAASGTESDTQPLAQSVIHYLQGDSAGALRLLLAVEQSSRTPDLLAALGYIQTEQGHHEAAAETYSELMQKQPGMAEGWFQWGFNLYRLGRTAEALERFDRAAALTSDWIDVPLARAICQLKLKQYTEAFERTDECLAMDSSYKPALFAKAVIFHVQWEFDQALALYRQIVDGKDPECIEALMNLITLGLQQKQYDLVRKYSGQLVALQPDAALAVEGMAISAFNDSDYDTAWREYKRLVELAPDQVANWLSLGVVCERRGMLSEAVQAFTKARQMRPDSLYAHTYLAGALWKSGDLQAARVCYEQAVAKWPEKENLTLSLAQILEDLGNLEASEKVCRELCNRDPERRQVWFRLGYIQFKCGQWEEAARSFERSLSLKSDWPEAEVDLALACYMAAQNDRAEAVLLRLLEREPEHLEGVKGLATVTLAQGRHEHALALHEKLLRLGGPDADVFFNCGILAQNLSQTRRAVDYYREAIALRPNFAEALLNLGHALLDLGNREEARSAWIPALELKPDFARGFFRRG
jgi:tetratricopeptide (TPR) repeat protein